MKSNPFPVLRINSTIRFVREDVLAWINRQKEAHMYDCDVLVTQS